MSNDEYTGSTRDNRCNVTDTSETNGVARPHAFHSGRSGVCREDKASGAKICESSARKIYLFIQAGWRRFSPIIKEPFYIIGESIVNIFEHPIIRATVYVAIIVCIIAFFIMIGYVAALHEYGIVPGNTPIGGR